jgi:hypothetical protein
MHAILYFPANGRVFLMPGSCGIGSAFARTLTGLRQAQANKRLLMRAFGSLDCNNGLKKFCRMAFALPIT